MRMFLFVYFLSRKTRWHDHIHPSRRLVILNGIENDYIKNIQADKIEGEFTTGRCHRMVAMKFRFDSLTWMNHKVIKSIPGYHHHFIGNHKKVKAVRNTYDWLTYYGSMSDRNRKMGIIKQLDAYFYETFGSEGASVAVLEAVASGVPVLAKSLGGTGELIRDGVNGFICKDRSLFLFRLQQLASKPEFAAKMRQKTLDDFNRRLHIKHTACKYVQLFESLANDS